MLTANDVYLARLQQRWGDRVLVDTRSVCSPAASAFPIPLVPIQPSWIYSALSTNSPHLGTKLLRETPNEWKRLEILGIPLWCSIEGTIWAVCKDIQNRDCGDTTEPAKHSLPATPQPHRILECNMSPSRRSLVRRKHNTTWKGNEGVRGRRVLPHLEQ